MNNLTWYQLYQSRVYDNETIKGIIINYVEKSLSLLNGYNDEEVKSKIEIIDHLLGWNYVGTIFNHEKLTIYKKEDNIVNYDIGLTIGAILYNSFDKLLKKIAMEEILQVNRSFQGIFESTNTITKQTTKETTNENLIGGDNKTYNTGGYMEEHLLINDASYLTDKITSTTTGNETENIVGGESITESKTEAKVKWLETLNNLSTQLLNKIKDFYADFFSKILLPVDNIELDTFPSILTY